VASVASFLKLHYRKQIHKCCISFQSSNTSLKLQRVFVPLTDNVQLISVKCNDKLFNFQKNIQSMTTTNDTANIKTSHGLESELVTCTMVVKSYTHWSVKSVETHGTGVSCEGGSL